MRPGPRTLAPLLLLGLLARPAAGATPPADAAAPGGGPPAAGAASPAAVVPGALTVTPERLTIDLLFNGGTLAVRARVPRGDGAAVTLQSPRERLNLKRLGKKGGVLWMGVGEVTFTDIPAVYEVISTAPLASLAREDERDRWRIGYEALVPAARPEAALRGELVKLKTRAGFFTLGEGRLQPAGGDAATAGAASQLLEGSFRLPAAAPPGDYTIELVGFHDGRGVRLGTATVHLETVGAVRGLQVLAAKHGLLYGVTAVFIAIVVGLLTGLIFRPRSGDAH